MNENIIDIQATTIMDDLNCGLHSVLYKRIGDISISDIRIRDAFERLIKEVEVGNSISAAEVIKSADALLNKGMPDENAGNIIFCYDRKSNNSKVIKNSINGVYSLLTIHNGIALDLDLIGGSMESAQTKRFLVVPPKKCDRFIKLALKEGINLLRVGQVLSANKIILMRGSQIIETIDKSIINNSEPAISVSLGSEHFNAFLNGYYAACTLSLCDCISANNIVRFGLGRDLSYVFASAIGYFTAVMQYKTMQNRIVFTNENSSSVAVQRPSVADGDYFYLLKLRNDEKGMPDISHVAQLKYYLCEKKRLGIIKNVLPVKENIDGLLSRLSNESIKYESLEPMPENCFGVVVSVGRGESVNGIKLGYFKSI